MKAIEVSFDEQTFILQKEGGIPRYFTELIREFQADPSLGCTPKSQAHFGIARSATNAGLIRGVPGPDRLARRIAYAMNAPWRASAQRADLIHRTYYHPRFLPKKSDPPTVFTIYDFIPETYPELFAGGHPHLAKAEAIKLADGLICISNHSRDLLLEYFPSVDAHVSVAPLGVSEFWFDGTSKGDEDCRPEGAYLLYVGRRDSYKDFDILLEALSRTSVGGPDLIVAGGGPLTRIEHELVRRLGLGSRVHWVAPTDIQLRALYRNATAFVFPSRLEGFGLPTLEAMASGCAAVLLADTPISREVGGTSAIYFQAGSADSLERELEGIESSSSEDRISRVRRARAWARTFTWRRTARQTRHAYEQVLGLHR